MIAELHKQPTYNSNITFNYSLHRTATDNRFLQCLDECQHQLHYFCCQGTFLSSQATTQGQHTFSLGMLQCWAQDIPLFLLVGNPTRSEEKQPLVNATESKKPSAFINTDSDCNIQIICQPLIKEKVSSIFLN